GDVGRPDLLDGKMTKEELASMMYDSLNNKIKPLADDILLYPGHGPGSSCGKNLGPETHSTIGQQKLNNYALQEMTREEFIRQVTDGITPAPAYFFEDAKLNKAGYISLEEVIQKGNTALSLENFTKHRSEGVRVLDVRIPDEFENGFIPGAMNIGLNGQYAIWAGTLIPIHEPLLLVIPQGQEEEAITRLARVGFDHILGYLHGGMATWTEAGNPVDMIISITPEELALDFKHSEIKVLDVRKASEWDTCHLEGAHFASLQDLEDSADKLDKEGTYYVHCAGGYRSMIAASILRAKGFQRIKNIYGGWSKIKELDLPKVMPATQSA
ncbi:MAG: MBL fold metallo-hydrolase, partial [Bacteroidota bacterium]|nr:MBL fold metallo-hydrolase [Bacteroidota bacterium]MDX5431805.1 MBL fold metallo-hydrolase [Bacteroidota bacterium]MDX5470516.1 MBL fold metallo-hydrolase [Bacteroidota bacterium]